MKALPLTQLAAHVAAWHNRHPLAHHISEAQVHSMGFVVLPFVASGTVATAPRPAVVAEPPPASAAAAEGATLRERAIAKARQEASVAPGARPAAPDTPARPVSRDNRDALSPAFSENLMPPLSVAKMARWVARHGAPAPAPASGAPVRQVAPDPGVDNTQVSALWVQTALVEVGRQHARLLIGPGPEHDVLGARLWSRPRLAGLATLVLAAIGLGTVLLTGTPPAAEVMTASVPDAAAAASAAATPAETGVPTTALAADAGSAPATAPEPLAPAASAPGSDARTLASATALGAGAPASAAPAADRPAVGEATLGQVTLPSLGPRLDLRRQAQQPAQGPATEAAAPPAEPAPARAALAAPAAPAAPPAAAAAPSPRAETATGQTGASAPTRLAFALTTRLLRTRTESHQVADALRALLVTPQTPQRQVQVLPEGEDFRVVVWPYAQRAEAEQMRAQLAARGLKVTVIDF